MYKIAEYEPDYKKSVQEIYTYLIHTQTNSFDTILQKFLLLSGGGYYKQHETIWMGLGVCF